MTPQKTNVQEVWAQGGRLAEAKNRQGSEILMMLMMLVMLMMLMMLIHVAPEA